jgi:hypothetical protein
MFGLMCQNEIIIAWWFRIVFDFKHAILVMSDPMNAIEPITNNEDYF